jgi:hypothetical protein
MKDKIAAVAFNLRNLLWRTEELKKTVEKEIIKGKRKNIYDIQKSVNNLMTVLRLADENLKELEGLIGIKNKDQRTKEKV